MSNTLVNHCTTVKGILRYLKGTLSYGLRMQPAFASHPFSIIALCDANWTSDIDDRKFTYDLQYLGYPISFLGDPASNVSLLDQALKLNIVA